MYYPSHLAEYYRQKKEYLTAFQYVLKMAQIKSRLKLSEEKSLKLDEEIYNKADIITYGLAGDKKFKEGFRLINRLDAYLPHKYMGYSLKGVFTFHSGQKKKGMDLVYKAHDSLIKEFPIYKEPLRMSIPLKGYYKVNGNSSRTVITHAGLDRFCFDFTGTDKNGNVRRHSSKETNTNQDYFGFGRPIYSPINGVVESLKDDQKDIPPSNTYQLVRGNHISIKSNKGYHYIFVHHKYRSAIVKKGETVKVGQPIVSLGNTGMTTVPHLHFCVYSKNWMTSIPIIFNNYSLIDKKNIQKPVPEDVPETNSRLFVN